MKIKKKIQRLLSAFNIFIFLAGIFLPLTPTLSYGAEELVPYKYWGVSIDAKLNVRPSGGQTIMELLPGRNLQPASGTNFFDSNLFGVTLDGILTSDASIPREYELTDNSILTFEDFHNQAMSGEITKLENKSINDWLNEQSLFQIGEFRKISTGLPFSINGQKDSKSFYIDINIPDKDTMYFAPFTDRNGTSDGSDRRYDTTITFVLRAKHEKWNEELGEWDIDSKVEAKLSMSEYSPARWNYKDFDNGYSSDYAVRMDASQSTSARPKVTYTYDAGVDNNGNIEYAGEESSSHNIHNYYSEIYPSELTGRVYQNGNFKVGGSVEVEDDRGESKFAYANTNVNYQIYNQAPNALSAFTDKGTGSSKYLYAQRPVSIKDTSTDPENELMDISYKLYSGTTEIAKWELTKDLISSPFRIKNETFDTAYINAMDVSPDTKTADVTFIKDGNYRLEQITGDIRNHSIVSQLFSSRTYTLNIRKVAAPPVADFEYRLNGKPTDFTYPNVAVALLDKSTDPNDDISNWLWTRYDSTTANTQEGVTAVFPAEGIYNTTLKVTDFLGLSDSITKPIEVLPPIPKAEITTNEAESLMKENRKIILSAEDSFAPPGDPIQWEKTIWEITPLDGQDPQSMKTLTSQSSGKKKTMVFKETGQYKVSIELFNNFTIANPDHPRIEIKKKTIIIDIKEDKNPIAEFAVTGNSPNFKDNPASTIAKVENTSLSEDSDFFDDFPTPAGDNDYYGRGADSFLWEIRKDSNEDSVFDENEVYGKFSGREIDIPVTFKENEGTEYQATLITKETFGQPTITDFVEDTDRRTTIITKNFNINWIPDIIFDLPAWAYPINPDNITNDTIIAIDTDIKDERVNTTKVVWSLEKENTGKVYEKVDIAEQTINNLNKNGGNIEFKESGFYKLVATITDEKGQSSSYSKEIRIYPLPQAVLTDDYAWDNTNHPQPFNAKQNRKYKLSGSSSHINDEYGNGIHPIDHDKDYWEIKPLNAQGLESIRVAQGMLELNSEDGTIFKSTNRKLDHEMLFKLQGTFKVRYQVTNSIGKKSKILEQIITVHEDQVPLVDYRVSEKVYRDPEKVPEGTPDGETPELKASKATLLAYSIKVSSPDRDSISLERVRYRFDSNNNGSFADEEWKDAGDGEIDKTDNNDWNVSIIKDHVGKYQFAIYAEETYGQETIDRFVDKSGVDKRSNEVIKDTEIDNIAPLADLDGYSVNDDQVEILVTHSDNSKYSKQDISNWINSNLKPNLQGNNIYSSITYKEITTKKFRTEPKVINLASHLVVLTHSGDVKAFSQWPRLTEHDVNLNHIKDIAPINNRSFMAYKEDGSALRVSAGNFDYITPVSQEIADLKQYIEISVRDEYFGGSHIESIGLKMDGTIKIFQGGKIDFYKPHLERMTGVSKMVVTDSPGLMLLKTNGTVETLGLPEPPYHLSNVEDICMMGFHPVAIKKDGTAVAWGPTSGQNVFYDYMYSWFPNFTQVKSIVSSSSGQVLGINKDGTVVTWGVGSGGYVYNNNNYATNVDSASMSQGGRAYIFKDKSISVSPTSSGSTYFPAPPPITEVVPLDRVVSLHSWSSSASKKVVISFDDGLEALNESNKTQLINILTSNEIDYLHVGNTSTKNSVESFTNSLSKPGLFIDNSNSLATIAVKTVEFIKSLFSAITNIGSYWLIYNDSHKLFNYEKYYSDYENDPQYDIHQWKYEHNPNHFENPLGEITEAEDGYSNSSFNVFENNFKTGTSTGGINKFSKTGRYLIGYRTKDNPVGTDDRFDNYRKWSTMPNGPMEVFVHRKPLAEFTFRINKSGANITVTADSKAYDLDHESEPKKGIVTKEWHYKDINASTWTLLNGTESVSFSGETTKDYFLKHRVRDIDGPDGLGEWSEEIKLITTKPLPPTAKFDITPKIYQVRSGQIIKVQDKSTDPNDDPLVEYRWNLTKTEIPRYNKTLTNPIGITQSQVDAVANDIQNTIEGMGHAAYGIWTLELQVRDNTGAWGNPLSTSNIYKQQFEVIPNNQPPVASINPTNVFVDGQNSLDKDSTSNPLNEYIDWKSIVSDPDPDNKGFIYRWELEHHEGSGGTLKSTKDIGSNDKLSTKVYTSAVPFSNQTYESQNLKPGPYKVKLTVTDIPMYGSPKTVTVEKTNYIIPKITGVPYVILEEGKDEIVVGDTVTLRVITDEYTTGITAQAENDTVSLSLAEKKGSQYIWETDFIIPEIEESGEMDITFTLTTDFGSDDVFGTPGQITRTKTLTEVINVTALKLIDFRITNMVKHPQYKGLYPLRRPDFLLNYIAGYYVTFQIDSKGNPTDVIAVADIDGSETQEIQLKKAGLNTWEGKYFAPYNTPKGSIVSFNLEAKKGTSKYNYNEKNNWDGETLLVTDTLLKDAKIQRTN